MLAGDLEQTVVSVDVLVDAGATRPAVDPWKERRCSTVSCSSSTMLRPLDQYTAVGVWLGRRASISSTLGSRAAHHHLDVHQPVQAEARRRDAGRRRRRRPACRARRRSPRRSEPLGAGGRRPSGPGLPHRRHDALAVVGRVEFQAGDLQRDGVAAPGEHLERQRRSGDVLLDHRPMPRAARRASAAASSASSSTTETPSLPLAASGFTTAGKPQAGHGRGRGTSSSANSLCEASLDSLTR